MPAEAERSRDEQKENEISLIIDWFKRDGSTLLAREGHYVHGCAKKDVLSGAVSDYTEIDSQTARDWVSNSLKNGYSYQWAHTPKSEE